MRLKSTIAAAALAVLAASPYSQAEPIKGCIDPQSGAAVECRKTSNDLRDDVQRADQETLEAAQRVAQEDRDKQFAQGMVAVGAVGLGVALVAWLLYSRLRRARLEDLAYTAGRTSREAEKQAKTLIEAFQRGRAE